MNKMYIHNHIYTVTGEFCDIFYCFSCFKQNFRKQTAVRSSSVLFLSRGVEADCCWTCKMCLNRLHYLSTSCPRPQSRPCANPPGACKEGFAVYTVISEASAVPERVSGWMKMTDRAAGVDQDIIHLLNRIYFWFLLSSPGLNTVM